METQEAKLERMMRVLNECYTDTITAQAIQHDPALLRQRLTQINRIVCAALNQE